MKFLINIFRKISELMENRIGYIDNKPVDTFIKELEKEGLSELSSPRMRLKNHANGQEAISEKLESDRNQN